MKTTGLVRKNSETKVEIRLTPFNSSDNPPNNLLVSPSKPSSFQICFNPCETEAEAEKRRRDEWQIEQEIKAKIVEKKRTRIMIRRATIAKLKAEQLQSSTADSESPEANK
jgi:hypothetical protein